VRVTACEVTSDAGQAGIEPANTIQKWDSKRQQWTEFWRILAIDIANRHRMSSRLSLCTFGCGLGSES
jgi:hypothetical protein